MANDFQTMYNRITTELRRTNLTTEAKTAINDAITEAAQTRFYFNEVRALTFPTVPGQEYYADLGLVEIDALYFFNGTARQNVELENNVYADDYASGNVSSGQLTSYSRQGDDLRLWPVPNAVVTVYIDGYGKLTPWPLVNPTDTNAWMVEGERYIRALAKRNLLRDVIRDYGEARVYDAVAEDYYNGLVSETSQRFSTGTLRGTQF